MSPWFDKFTALYQAGMWDVASAVVEICLLTALFYFLWKFLRGTRGAGVLRGMFVLLILMSALIFFVAEFLFKLEHISWLVERSISPMIIAAVVVFQPELRRGLLRLGMHPVFTRLVGAGSPVIDEIVEAANALSRRKVGALICIQRRVNLAEFVDRGSIINGEVSAELLQSIFQPGTPLHDGAVIIHGGRIGAAGSLCPISEDPEMSKQLGTRHRAGVGMSEDNDSVSVIVSEETGRISLAVDGKLQQGLKPAELKRKLTELCLESVEAPTAQGSEA